MDFEIWLKIYTNVPSFETASLKPCKLLKFFYQFWDNCKIPSCTYYLKEAEMKVDMFAYFKEYREYHGYIKGLRVYMIVVDAVSKLETVVWILNHLKVHSSVSVHPKISQTWSNDQSQHNLSCSGVSLIFEARSSSLLNFGTANCVNTLNLG